MSKVTPIFLALLIIGNLLGAAANISTKILYQLGIEPNKSSVVGLKITRVPDSILTSEHFDDLKGLDCGIEYLDLSAINVSSTVLTRLKEVFKDLKQIRVNGDIENFRRIFKEESEQLNKLGISVVFEAFTKGQEEHKVQIELEWIDNDSRKETPREKHLVTQCGCSLL